MSDKGIPDGLNQRSLTLLKTLIERYIEEGQPVGSRTLARASGMSLSSATIRNVMADLDELGLVTSPHTSAGRIPTIQGYRLFVDNLLQIERLREREYRAIRRQLEIQQEHHPDSQTLLEEASSLLSGFTHMAAIVTVPRRVMAVLRQIEFLPLSDNRVLAILVINQHEVQNRIIETDREYSDSELKRAANYLNTLFAGQDMHSIREALLNELLNTRETVDEVMAEAVTLAGQVLSGEEANNSSNDYVVAGQNNLMQFDELADVERLHALFDAFGRKRDLLRLFDHCLDAQGVQIFIGEESGYNVLDECSVVTSPYTIDDQVVGVLGVIGPTRMAYDRVIPVVDATARLLGKALNRS